MLIPFSDRDSHLYYAAMYPLPRAPELLSVDDLRYYRQDNPLESSWVAFSCAVLRYTAVGSMDLAKPESASPAVRFRNGSNLKRIEPE